MPDHYFDPALAQSFNHIALGHVRALHFVAKIVHHLSYAGHANATNADEVDRANIGCNTLHALAPASAPPPQFSAFIPSTTGGRPRLSIKLAKSRVA